MLSQTTTSSTYFRDKNMDPPHKHDVFIFRIIICLDHETATAPGATNDADDDDHDSSISSSTSDVDEDDDDDESSSYPHERISPPQISSYDSKSTSCDRVDETKDTEPATASIAATTIHCGICRETNESHST
jgi:hypothetical protein